MIIITIHLVSNDVNSADAKKRHLPIETYFIKCHFAVY